MIEQRSRNPVQYGGFFQMRTCSGDVLIVRDLYYGLLLVSGNDAANVSLPNTIPGQLTNLQKKSIAK